MKTMVTVIISWFIIPVIIAQDTTTTCLPKKTLVIRKKQNPKATSTQAPKEVIVPVEKEISVLEVTIKDSLEAVTAFQKVPAQLPTLAAGDFGLMNIQPYQKGMDLKNWKFVALEYSVNQYGWVSEVAILKTNDSRLKNVVLRRLKQSKWNPAIDQLGVPIEYKMYQQVVIVKDRTYEEDYTRDY